MTRTRFVAATLVATSLLGGVAFANEKASPQAGAPISAAQKTADRDVGKRSKDGAQAFRDLHLARIAIFDADPAQAKTLIGKAQTALTKAKSDETVYMKAEADLQGSAKSAASAKAAADTSKTSDASKAPAASDGATASTEKSASATPSTQPTAWLPVDGQLTLGEDFVATPAKATAVSDANKSLEKGDRKGAVDRLKLADVDVSFVLAVVPLQQTTADVDQAASLLAQGKYYEANAVLKRAEDGLRFDVVDSVGLPPKASAAAAAQK